MAQVLVDTSAIYALIASDDAHHKEGVAILRSLPEQKLTPALTNFIAAETHALLLSRLGAAVARAWLLDNIWSVEPVGPSDEEKARAIIRRYEDKTFSYTDATSFAVMERLEIEQAFSFDPHFQQYGFTLMG